MEQSIFDPHIPYVGPIYGSKFSPGDSVKIQGLPPGTAYRFNINLQCGYEIVPPRDDVAIQVAVQLLDGHIALNSYQHGNWGEEQLGTLLLKRNEQFEIAIACDFTQYKVSINGQHYCEFPQRINHNRITHLAIDGDVSIFRIFYESTTGTPARNKGDDFELIDATTNRLSREQTSSPPRAVELSQAPSYTEALNASNKPLYPGISYPTNGSEAAYPTKHPGAVSPINNAGAAYPINNSGAAYPINNSGAAYPINNAGAAYPINNSGAAYPTNASGVSYPPPGSAGPYPPPPPPGAVVMTYPTGPPRPNCKKRLLIGCGTALLVVIVIIIIAVIKFGTRKLVDKIVDDYSHHSNTYDSHRNDYGSDQYYYNN